MIHGYLDDWNGIGEESAQEMGIEKISDKEKDVSLGGDFRVLSDERIGKIRIVFCKQKEPSEKKIGDRGIVPDLLGYCVFWHMGK